jgi:hypothetical protein
MRVLVNEFFSLDGVSRAPGGPDEDADGGFAHGGWSHPYFDPDVMGPMINGQMDSVEALLFGRRSAPTPGVVVEPAWVRRRARPPAPVRGW